MANSWFQFKQFKINQDKTAMKVGTDGVLLGAWADTSGASSILDVGVGTGLIALMLAQRTPHATIAAIDVEPNAVAQATQNAAESPWADRIGVELADYTQFRLGEGQLFDLIVSNPPYFRQSLKPTAKARALARHSHELSYEALIGRSLALLKPAGRLAVILPYVEGSVFIALAAAQGLYCSRKLNVYPTPGAEIKRLLLELRLDKVKTVEEDLVIEDAGRHGYSADYPALTKDFYLFG